MDHDDLGVFADPDAPAHVAAGLWRSHSTLIDDLIAAADASPDKTAAICYGETVRRTSYRQLHDRVTRLALLLTQQNVRRGDVVAIQLPNSEELIALALAVCAVGAIPAPILPAMRAREVEYILKLTESQVYFGAESFRGFSYLPMLEEVSARLAQPPRCVLVATSDESRARVAAAGFPCLSEWEAAPVSAESPKALRRLARTLNADDVCQLMFTSGTTGEPKGVMHTHNTLYAMNKVQADVMGLDSATITCMGSPTAHQAGYTWNFIMPLILGATAVQVERWDPDLVLDIIEREKVTFFMGAPTFLIDLIAAQESRPRDLSTLVSFVTGSAPIAPHLTEAAHRVLGCRLYSEWGMTENGCVTVTRRSEPMLRASECDGSAVDGMAVRITADDGSSVTAVGPIGELQVKGASQCTGYFRRPETYAECLTSDGWFRTGDLARWTDDEGIRICGRTKDIISRGGEKIPVAEVESALLGMAAVRDVAVIAVPDARLGERSCAVLVTDGAEPSLPEITRHLEALGMAKIYWPEEIRLVESLPRTTTGKVQKFLLREGLGSL
ncbi:AMP-binding protein [Nocardia sp. NPDC050793]|uniref:AMP-binding protein n=1 Tax=Nocardia sp. NPDC050793 TaxID=3155159 RepID=UPI00340C7E98